MTRTEHEFQILKDNVSDPIIAPFEKEITDLVHKFMKSGQSGGSAPMTASAISQAVENLCNHKPLYGITGEDAEWSNSISRDDTYQNNRLSSVFKKGVKGKAYYLNAIVFCGQNGSQFTSNGSVKDSKGNNVRSSHYIKSLPFKPKTFYIDVIETEWHKDKETGELTKQEGGGWWTSVLKDDSQLDEVWEYYERFDSAESVE